VKGAVICRYGQTKQVNNNTLYPFMELLIFELASSGRFVVTLERLGFSSVCGKGAALLVALKKR
jgi:hypothetical protein